MVYIKHTANNFQCNVINQFWLYKNGKILKQPIYEDAEILKSIF